MKGDGYGQQWQGGDKGSDTVFALAEFSFSPVWAVFR